MNIAHSRASMWKTALATGLPSLGGPFENFGLGGLAVQNGKLYSIVQNNPQALGNPADLCKGAPDVNSCVATMTAVVNDAGTLNGLKSLTSNRGWKTLAEVGRFDFNYAAAHPDPGNPEYAPGDADPFGLTAGPSGGFYVIDAASNTLDFVSRRGDISVLAFIPDPPGHKPIYDAAPTCAARMPNGNLVIGTESNSLWRWNGRKLTRLLSGGKLGQIVGCVADRNGNIYLANLASQVIPGLIEKPFDGSNRQGDPEAQDLLHREGPESPNWSHAGARRSPVRRDQRTLPKRPLAAHKPELTPRRMPSLGQGGQARRTLDAERPRRAKRRPWDTPFAALPLWATSGSSLSRADVARLPLKEPRRFRPELAVQRLASKHPPRSVAAEGGLALCHGGDHPRAPGGLHPSEGAASHRGMRWPSARSFSPSGRSSPVGERWR
jgi:hypothetical protein